MTTITKSLLVVIALGVATGCSTTKPIDPIPDQGTINRSITWVLAEDPSGMCDANLG